MTVYVIYGDAADDTISSNNATYSTARAGSGLGLDGSTGTANLVGQEPGFFVYQGFIGFDTSGVAGVIGSAVLSLQFSNDFSTTDFDIEARLKDWGVSVTTADWTAGASLGGLTLLANKNTSTISTSGYHDFVDSAMVANINTSGFTRMVLCSSRQRNNNSPSSNEYVLFRTGDTSGTSQDPKLTVTTVDPAGVLRPSIRNVLHNLIR